MSDAAVGRFYGVYLLCSESTEKHYKGKCYIGFTVNPNRRINQHNRGKDFGGAKKTNNKGPWKMILIVHGFPNNIAALQFEWAWQQPSLSTRLKHYTDLKRKQPKETYFQYNFRILTRMLAVGPWNRLPLIIRWLQAEYECAFPVELLPPRHMQIVSGGISIVREKALPTSQPRALWAPECHLCMQRIENPERSRIGCLNIFCKLTCHIICLANHFIAADAEQRGHYIPISGQCPLCETTVTWGALLQRKQKLQGIGEDEEHDVSDDEVFCSEVEFIDISDSEEANKEPDNS